jgi:hypothetical protein
MDLSSKFISVFTIIYQLENGSMKIEEGDVALSAATNECEDLK